MIYYFSFYANEHNLDNGKWPWGHHQHRVLRSPDALHLTSLMKHLGRGEISFAKSELESVRIQESLIQIVDVQGGNAAAVMGTIPATRDWAEVSFLPL